ncbi:MAG TPA: DUF2249 domain-containing protein [Bacillales bacterium]|nr:DUF2249 domain-containing protein [Bacillales bacterium]
MTQNGKTVELDVRPILKAKKEPFKDIMEAVKSLEPEDTFVLHATFKPVPLFKVMERKGFLYEAIHEGKSHWIIRFWKERKE